MENLTSSIQHNKHNLVVTIFFVVVTAVMVILPFHKPSVYPNPSSKQEAQIKKDATSSANVLGASQTDSSNQKAELKPKQSNSPTANPTSPSTHPQTSQATQNISSQSNTNNNVPGQQSSSQFTPPVANTIINIIVPTQAPTSQQTPVNTPIPVDHSLDLQICLSNEESNWQSIMEQLNRRGVWYSGEADQARSDHAARVQSCYQQYGN